MDALTRQTEQRASDAVSLWDEERLVNETDRRMKLISRVHDIIAKNIDLNIDVVFVHGQPCRTKDLANKLFRMFGGDFEYIRDAEGRPVCIRHDYRDEKGSYYAYEVFGRYRPSFGGGYVEASGWFSSRDDFFGTEKDGEGEKVFKQTSQIDEQNICRAAQTECFKKAVFAGLGLPKWTKEYLESLKMDTGRIGGHKGEVKGKKGGNTDGEESKESRGEIERMCRELWKAGIRDPETEKPFPKPEDILRYCTMNEKFKGWGSFTGVTEKSLGYTLKDVRKVYDSFMESVTGEGVYGSAPTTEGDS